MGKENLIEYCFPEGNKEIATADGKIVAVREPKNKFYIPVTDRYVYGEPKIGHPLLVKNLDSKFFVSNQVIRKINLVSLPSF